MTKIFKQAKIAGAVAAAMMTGLAATSVQAVNLSSNGLGEVALVPYYSAKNGYDTSISIVNTDPVNVIAVKIRFRERDNSRDARDFLIYLSPNDVWTGTVTMKNVGGVATPVIQTNDVSCTMPALLDQPADGDAAGDGIRGVAFTTIGYDGASPLYPSDGGSTSIDRTYDGHIEIIQMGHANPAVSEIAAQAVHTAAGTPLSCPNIVRLYGNGAQMNDDVKAQFNEPLNVMKVAANLINVNSGIAVPMPVTILANFFNPLDATQDIMATPSDHQPDLGTALPKVANQIVDDGLSVGEIISDSFENNLNQADAVSSLFMATGVINEYAIGGASRVLNDWLLTFPTKFYYVDSPLYSTSPEPFSHFFPNACESVSFDYFNREERTPGTSLVVDFSPPPPGVPGSSICHETSILAFSANNSVLAGVVNEQGNYTAPNVYGVPLNANFTNGWMRLNFTGSNATTVGITSTNAATIPNHRYFGLPVIGFGIKTYTNGTNSAGVRLDYGVTQEHAYQRNIVTVP